MERDCPARVFRPPLFLGHVDRLLWGVSGNWRARRLVCGARRAHDPAGIAGTAAFPTHLPPLLMVVAAQRSAWVETREHPARPGWRPYTYEKPWFECLSSAMQ